MRSRSISPSTSIRSRSSDYSDSDDSDDTSRYDGLTEAELNEIWERRNLAYFDRRQRKLAEEKERQQQQGLSNDDTMAHASSSSSSNSSSSSAHVHLGASEADLSAAPSSSVKDQQQQLARPEGFLCAADCPEWRDFTSRNIMGEYDPERASRDPAYLSGWMSCERLVNMNKTGATAGNFIPTNPRLAALMEHRRLDVAREKYEEEAMRRQQQQQSQGGDFQQHKKMMVDESCAAQQAAEYERLNQAHKMQQQRESAAYAQGGNSSPKSSSSGSSAAGEKIHAQSNVQPAINSYYMALPNPTHQLTKLVRCDYCNRAIYTAVPATQFFCQSCGCVSSVPSEQSEALYDEKMQDAEDLDCKMSYNDR